MYDENETMVAIGEQEVMSSLSNNHKRMIMDIAEADGKENMKPIIDGFILGYMVGRESI